MKNFLGSPLLYSIFLIQSFPTYGFVSTFRTVNKKVPNLPANLTPQLLGEQQLQRFHKSRQSLIRMNATPLVGSTSSIVLPSLKKLFLSCLLPTLIGLWKYEYGVSYAYGTSTALSSFFILKPILNAPTSAFTTLVQIHAAAIIFYGVRLNIFLLYRELFLERFRRMRERIEDRQTKKEEGAGTIGRLINRIPFIISCSLLYLGLVSPQLTSAKSLQMINQCGIDASNSLAWGVYKSLVGLTWIGFVIAAIGDLTKTMVKSWKGPDHLVTGGMFALFRHPNYTGEVIGWTSNFLASTIAMYLSGYGVKAWKDWVIPMLLGSLGLLGIIFVLTAATTNLERRQKEKYGEIDAYKNWKAWAGFQLPVKKS